MVTNVLLAKIVAEKDKTMDVKCFNCGKKLFECKKSKGNTAKNTGICVAIKCNRCREINEFIIN